MDAIIRDGHSVLTGMDGSTEPSYLADGICARSINRKFRGGLNSTRPRYDALDEVFETPESEELFRNGNVQGAMAYMSTGSNYDVGLLVAIAGTIFFGKVSTKKIEWRELLTGAFDPTFLHFWFVQAANMVYGQNGADRPFEWNGSDALATVLPESGITPNGIGGDTPFMPIGNIMAYSHGYVAVVNDINQIAISDHIYEFGFGAQGAMHVFSSTADYKGGLFGVPANLGNITGAYTLPQSRFRNGQGELVFFADNGAFALDLAPQRELWEDTKTTLVGAGCVAPYSIIPVNNDLWYRRPDGISAYKQSRNDEDSKWVDIPLSREVNNWLCRDSEWLLRYVSMAYFDNRILCTVFPQREPNQQGYGDHRFFNGLVALDLDPGSTTSQVDGGFGWDGLWTGPRVTQIVTLDVGSRRRCFVFSFDKDKKNRTYELTTKSGTDPESRKIEGSYVTKKFSFSNPLEYKVLKGGRGMRVISRGKSKFTVKFRPDDTVCWHGMGQEIAIGCDSCEGQKCAAMREANSAMINLEAPEPGECLEGSDNTANIGIEFQFRIAIVGDNDVKSFFSTATPQPSSELATCEIACNPVKCCEEYDFKYQWE